MKSMFLFCLYHSLISIIFPLTAVAAAINGLESIVLDPGPCLPSKFLFDVETHISPGGILSSFIAKHAEHPGCLISKPELIKILSNPSFLISFKTFCDPGTIKALTFLAFFLSFMYSATILKSSILELVQLPINT